MSVGVVIGTFGDRQVWGEYAERALASVDRQTYPVDDFCWAHGETLQQARNQGAEIVGDCDYLIFLDADDELDCRYVESMVAAERQTRGPWWGIYRPATLGVVHGVEDDAAVLIPKRDLRTSNYIVIGAMCSSDLFFQVGGFDDYPILEDWALWRKMVAEGAEVFDVVDAIYRVNVREKSRNTDERLHGEIYARIRRELPL